MNELYYSPLVKKKLIKLKKWLIEHFDKKTAKEVVEGIISDSDILTDNERAGIDISKMYNIDTEYWYLFTHQQYLIYRFDSNKVTIVQMFSENEDFMMKLFGISGRTQESIDFWGE